MSTRLLPTLTIGVITLMAGCNGAQPPIGAPGAMPQTSTSVSVQAEFGTADTPRNLARHETAGGKYPQARLIDVDGTLYGTTNNGGAFRSPKTCHGGCGTVFSITTSGVVKVLHSFGNAQDGQYPADDLVPVTDPDLKPDVRTCAECGCTDAFACEGGCSWVSELLFSSCDDT
jgi:uncharacterized repeat protein (TIGR03803 family)